MLHANGSHALVLGRLEEFASVRALRVNRDEAPDGLPQISVYSEDMRYRYAFGRWWRTGDPFVLWVALNPATGDTERRRRPTLERCMTWSKDWGAGGLIFINLFAARDTNPKALKKIADPIGPHNDAVTRLLSPLAGCTVVAWGAKSREARSRSDVVVRQLVNPYCLGTTLHGQPRHPLYVRGDAIVRPWP